MNVSEERVYFSIPTDFVITGKPMPYDLYVNSSGIQGREKFVRIFPLGDSLNPDDLRGFKDKYRQLYIPEDQRSVYLKSLGQVTGKDPTQMAGILKDSAIHYLGNIFTKEPSTEMLSQTISGCKDVVTNMVGMLEGTSLTSLQEMVANLSFHDFYTYDHSINVAMYSILIYKAVHPTASQAELTQAGLGGLLHDLGKVKIPNRIINSPGELTTADLIEMRKHPDYGLTLMNDPKILLPDGLDKHKVSCVVHEHHENFDGTGYPNKKGGNNIHEMARITAIADFFDAITTKRSYHEPLSTEDALSVMRRSVEKKLDPVLFELFAHEAEIHDHARVAKIELPEAFDPCQPSKKMADLLQDARTLPKNIRLAKGAEPEAEDPSAGLSATWSRLTDKGKKG